MLEPQISQQASSSSAPLGRQPHKPKPNPREHCNCIILRTNKQFEGCKDARVEEDGEKNHDKSDLTLPCEDKSQEQNESERSKEPKPPSSEPYMHLFPLP